MKWEILEIVSGHSDFIISLYCSLGITPPECLSFKHKLHETFPTIAPPLPPLGTHARKLFVV